MRRVVLVLVALLLPLQLACGSDETDLVAASDAGESSDDAADAAVSPSDAASVPDAADARSAPPADAAPSCTSPLVACGGACVDVRSDPTHCGSCDTTCAEGRVCSQSQCALYCAGGSTQCGSSCVDPLYDPANCGSCGNACGSNEVCANGVCALTCLGGSTQCGSSCVDTRDDPTNCGGCGQRCGATAVCVNAGCVALGGGGSDGGGADADGGSVTCPPNTTLCNGACVDTTTDSMDCGACFTVCATGLTCSGGACACPNHGTSCGGTCTDTTSDSNNCGACAAACLTNQVCSGSTCVCAPGKTSCSGVCTDTSIDMANCGSCGSTCTAGKVCTEGMCLAPTGDWSMLGNDAQHTGVNGAEQGVPPMIAEWTTQVALTSALSPVAIENGRVFVSFGDGATSPVVALNVADGSPLWTYNFGAVDTVGFPSAVDGVVYLQTNHGTQGNSYLWAIDAVAGTVGWASVFGSQWEHFWPPLVVGGSVYVDGGYYGGLYGFSAGDGSQLFFNSAIGQYDSWSPAYFGGNLYTFVDGTFQSESPTTGVASGSVAVTWNWAGYSMETAPVFGPSLAYIIAPPNLIAINPATHTVTWTANGSYTGMAAVANGVVYGISGGNLIARDASLGTLLWVFVGDQSLSFPPVVANGYVYVSSSSNTYAVDIATHASVWTAPVGGWLAVASQRLVVSGSTGTLHGFVLSHP